MSLNPRKNQNTALDSNLDELRLANGTTNPMPKVQDLGLDSTPPATPLAINALDSALPSNTSHTPLTSQKSKNTHNQNNNEGNAESSQTHTQEILANDLPEPKPYATTKQQKLALNANIINAINANNADEALDFLATQNTNISWDLVNDMRKNGINSSEILADIAKESAQNPRALWINLEMPLSQKELARNKYHYERSQINQDELNNLKESQKFDFKNFAGDILGIDALKSKDNLAKKQQADLTLMKFAERGDDFESLPKEAKQALHNRYYDESNFFSQAKHIFSGQTPAQSAYNDLKKQAKIYEKIKNKEHLSEGEKRYIDSYGVLILFEIGRAHV